MFTRTYVEFSTLDRVRIKGDSAKLVYTVHHIEFRDSAKYDPEVCDAVIVGNGISRTIPVSALELAV